jgi:tripartite-type tricarboxylate transporter receptor subunit TctC
MKPFILLAALLMPSIAAATDTAPGYPSRPVRFVVPYTPGAINDFIGRLVSQKLAEMWGQQVIVDNRAGGGTTIGTDIVAKSPPDGHTLLLTAVAFAVNATLYPKLPFDTLRDFAPVTEIGTAPMILAAAPQLPVKTVKELVAYAKSRPGQLSYASTGNGGSAHLMGEVFKSQAGIEVVHVPYKGLAPALNDVISGQLGYTFGSQLALEGQIKAGRLRAIAVIVTKLHADIVKVLNMPDVRERLSAQGVDIAATTPAEFGRFLREEVARWGKAVKQSGAKPD